MDWLQQTAIGKRDALRLTPHDDDREPSQDASTNISQDEGKEIDSDAGTGGRQELDGFGDEIPLTWAEVRELRRIPTAPLIFMHKPCTSMAVLLGRHELYRVNLKCEQP